MNCAPRGYQSRWRANSASEAAKKPCVPAHRASAAAARSSLSRTALRSTRLTVPDLTIRPRSTAAASSEKAAPCGQVQPKDSLRFTGPAGDGKSRQAGKEEAE